MVIPETKAQTNISQRLFLALVIVGRDYVPLRFFATRAGAVRYLEHLDRETVAWAVVWACEQEDDDPVGRVVEFRDGQPMGEEVVEIRRPLARKRPTPAEEPVPLDGFLVTSHCFWGRIPLQLCGGRDEALGFARILTPDDIDQQMGEVGCAEGPPGSVELVEFSDGLPEDGETVVEFPDDLIWDYLYDDSEDEPDDTADDD